METITLSIKGLGQDITKSIPADVASAWLAANELGSIEDAADFILFKIIREGTEAKARAEADTLMNSLKS